MRTMTSLMGLVLAAVLGAGPALAVPKECRSIQSRKDRNACYAQQEALSKQPASPRTKMNDAIDEMKQEDDRLTRRLQGICRGC